MTDLLCMSLPNFAENVAEKAEAVREDEDLDLRAVIGTPVNFREFDDLQEQHEFGEGEPSMLTRDLNASEEDGVVRVGGYGYPSWAFAADATDVLDKADRQLFGTTLFDATDLNTPHHAAMTLEQYASLVHDLAEHYGDDYAVITGTMSPNGTWQITDGGSLKRVGMLNFPGSVFAESGIADLKNGRTSWTGAQIVPVDALADDVRESCIEERGVADPEGVKA
jgi:hypothetical protein